LVTPIKIFIVDDDESVREAMEQLVRTLGYDTEAFASPEDLLSSDHIGDASCLITDLQMTGMSGFELHNQLVADGYRIPVIFMSAHPNESQIAAARAAGAIGFLDKPVDVPDLIGYLNRALRPHSS
jgi:FixJ family two-component response regulator